MFDKIVIRAKEFWTKLSADPLKKKRFIILAISITFIADYVMFSYITDKNIFDIFPSIPALESKKEINIYIPFSKESKIIKETRSVPEYENKESYVKFLVQTVIKGSIYENTAISVPMELFVKLVWIKDGVCAIDLEPGTLSDRSKVIPGSEILFKQALEKTVSENIPEIKKVYFLERGIPNKDLWEVN